MKVLPIVPGHFWLSQVTVIFLLLAWCLPANSQNVGVNTLTPLERFHVSGNIAIDSGRLSFLNTGESVFIGQDAGLNDNLDTLRNTYVGFEAGKLNITGWDNLAIGARALDAPTFTFSNIAIGNDALGSSTTGALNLAIGHQSLLSNTDGIENVGLGHNSLAANTIGFRNVAIGYHAMDNSIQGILNVAIGNDALGTAQQAVANVAIGYSAGNNTDGYYNTFIGAGAGEYSSGNNNVFIGRLAGVGSTGDHQLHISSYATNAPLIYGEFLKKRLKINDTLETKYFILPTGAANGYLLQSNAGGRASWVDPATVTLWNISGTNISNINTGNVGISTLTPAERLHVTGNIAIDSGRLSILNTGESIFIGKDAGLNDNLSNLRNTYIGYDAGKLNTGGSNIAIGAKALDSAASTLWNIAIGNDALGGVLQSGNENLAIGHGSMANNSTGDLNIAIGQSTLFSNTTGRQNVAVGDHVLDNLTTGSKNVAMGSEALGTTQTGDENVSVGHNAGYSNQSSFNTFLGSYAGWQSTGASNVFLGHRAGFSETGNNKLYIANSGTSSPLLYGEFDKKRLFINDTLSTKHLYLTSGAAAGYVLTSNSTGKISAVDPATLFVSPWTTSASDIYNANTGKVGIGETLPIEKLHVSGNIAIDSGRLSIINTGESILIGKDAGLNDNLNTLRNTYIGFEAGKLNAGGSNIAIGAKTLDAASNTFWNIAIGNDALGSATQVGNENLAIGHGAMANNTTGNLNVAIGQSTLIINTIGSQNVAVGDHVLDNLTTGNRNVAIGSEALGTTQTGDENVSVGYKAGIANQSSFNTFLGSYAGQQSTGASNVFLGHRAGYSESGNNKLYIANTGTSSPLIYGEFDKKRLRINDTLVTKFMTIDAGRISTINTNGNVIFGEDAGVSMSTGVDNTFIGFSSGALNAGGNNNNALGAFTLASNVDGESNVAIGNEAARYMNSDGNIVIGGFAGKFANGDGNVMIGIEAGQYINGEKNVAIGFQAGQNLVGSNQLYIENSAGTPLIYGDFAADKVGINTVSPASTFEVTGSVGVAFKNNKAAGTDHPDATGTVYRYTTGTGTITLPAASASTNRTYTIVNHTGATRNISSYTNISNAPSTTIANNASMVIISDGTGWFQVK